MTDILMIFPRPSAGSPQKNTALSIFYPGEAAAKEGFEVEYWDERFDSIGDLYKKASNTKIFGISSLSGYMLGRTIEILKWCKKTHPKKPTILGGVHVTFLPESSLRESFVDYAVLGEGEKRFPQLVKAILSGKGLEEIDGIGFKKDGKIIINERKGVLDLSKDYVSPLSERTERYFKIAAERNEVIMPSTRGCPWASRRGACTFCSVRDQYLGMYRVIPFEHWAKDIDRIYALHPFSFIELEDENSAYLIKSLDKYASHLQKKKIGFHLHLRADQLQDEKVIERLAQAGCTKIHIGVESGNDRVRNDIYNKREEKKCFYVAAKLLAKYGIEGVYTYVIGAPSETHDEMMETLKLSDGLRKLHPRGKSRSTVYVLIALPGTGIFETAKQHGWQIPETMEDWSRASAASNPTLPAEVNNIYFIAGLHHNRYHKTAQNFPGPWRLLIAPFEIMTEIRWQLGFFKFFKIEKKIIEKLIAFRSKK